MSLSIRVPTLLIDEARCRTNIHRMAEKAKRHQLHFRPHCKTHQSHQVASWLRDAGVRSIAVSSLRMADYFAADGWEDITVAIPVNLLEMDRINHLAGRIDLQLLVESVDAVHALDKGLHHPVSLFIEIDTGYGRSGVGYNDFAGINQILRVIAQSKHLQFVGFLGHAGHTYAARSPTEICEIHQDSLQKCQILQQQYRADYPNLIISMGDTPAASVAEEFKGIDELRPGNFVYYDLTQVAIGSCQEKDIAVAMACPVIARYPERGEVIIYGGGVHFSKDRLEREDGSILFGQVVVSQERNWGPIVPEAYVSKISQEHGTVSLPAPILAQTNIGDILLILPVHACMCADLMRRFATLTV